MHWPASPPPPPPRKYSQNLFVYQEQRRRTCWEYFWVLGSFCLSLIDVLKQRCHCLWPCSREMESLPLCHTTLLLLWPESLFAGVGQEAWTREGSHVCPVKERKDAGAKFLSQNDFKFNFNLCICKFLRKLITCPKIRSDFDSPLYS